MTIRADLTAALKDLLPPTIKIVDVPRSLDGLEAKRPVVLLYRTEVARAKNGQGALMHKFHVWVVSPNVDSSRAEDNLDATLDDVLTALETVNWTAWQNAQRLTFGDQQAPAYRIDLSVLSRNENN